MSTATARAYRSNFTGRILPSETRKSPQNKAFYGYRATCSGEAHCIKDRVLLDPFYGAGTVLIVLADRTKPTYIYDGALVMGNLMLAAHSLGIGSCWIHRAKEEFELPEGKEILKSLGIEGDYEGIGHCILGYADGDDPLPADRKESYVYKIE